MAVVVLAVLIGAACCVVIKLLPVRWMITEQCSPVPTEVAVTAIAPDAVVLSDNPTLVLSVMALVVFVPVAHVMTLLGTLGLLYMDGSWLLSPECCCLRHGSSRCFSFHSRVLCFWSSFSFAKAAFFSWLRSYTAVHHSAVIDAHSWFLQRKGGKHGCATYVISPSAHRGDQVFNEC